MELAALARLEKKEAVRQKDPIVVLFLYKGLAVFRINRYVAVVCAFLETTGDINWYTIGKQCSTSRIVNWEAIRIDRIKLGMTAHDGGQMGEYDNNNGSIGHRQWTRGHTHCSFIYY